MDHDIAYPQLTDYCSLSRITPKEFELLVKDWFESLGSPMECFEVNHLETIPGTDGEYTFDVTIRFKAFQGAQFLVLIECKKHKNSIKREVIQVLNERLRSVGGHKGFVIATSAFQSGAVEFARKHGIALVQVVSGTFMYIRATAAKEHRPLPPGIPRFAGCYFSQNPEGHISLELITKNDTSVLKTLLDLPERHDK